MCTDVDVMVGNFNQRNRFYLNDGLGNFMEHTAWQKIVESNAGPPRNYMESTDETEAITFADVDGDGGARRMSVRSASMHEGCQRARRAGLRPGGRVAQSHTAAMLRGRTCRRRACVSGAAASREHAAKSTASGGG